MIRLSIDGDMARLVLDRPEARNALSIAHWEALAGDVSRVADSGARLLVLSGAGGVFCAGADLSEFGRFAEDEALRVRFRRAMRAAMDAIAQLPIPVLAAVDGPCFGAGVALAMACDLRIAAPDARFAITPAKMGIGYPQEDVERLVALVGPGWASRLLFTGDAIDAGTALRIGLVEEMGSADAIVAAILACDSGSMAMLKRGIALALAGVRADDGQDARFDAMLGSPVLAEKLSRRRTVRNLPPSGA
jgi:enoyl-CoA hydratase/carnithine racemase